MVACKTGFLVMKFFIIISYNLQFCSPVRFLCLDRSVFPFLFYSLLLPLSVIPFLLVLKFTVLF